MPKIEKVIFIILLIINVYIYILTLNKKILYHKHIWYKIMYSKFSYDS